MIYVLLPAYNEESALPLLLRNFSELFKTYKIEYQIVVVDDGSTDNTSKIVEEFSQNRPVFLLKHSCNMGLGKAMKTGLSYISSIAKSVDFVMTMDADNTHDPKVVLSMIEKVKQDFDIIIASRYASGGAEIGLSILRKILSRGASFLLTCFFPINNVKDYTCGFRFYRASILKKAFVNYGDRFVEEKNFVCMAEILIKLSFLSARVEEVPLILRYDYKCGQSKMKKIKTILRYMVFIMKTKFRAFMREYRFSEN